MADSPLTTITSPTRLAKERIVATYVSTTLAVPECRRLAETAGGIVLTGLAGASAAVQLRNEGYEGWLAIDPAIGKNAKPILTQASLLSVDEWLDRERSAKVNELLSPGEFIAVADTGTLKRVIAEQAVWTQAAGSGRLVLYLDGRWLQNGRDQTVIDALALDADAATPVAIALGDTGDPLKLAGAVAGYAHLVEAVTDVAILRCDLGAIGGLAHGATWTSVGTGTSNRHFQPPNKKKSSGAPGDVPSALVRELLAFKMGTSLLALPKSRVPLCHLSCCKGKPLSRFNDKKWAAAVRAHNVETMAAIVAELLAVSDRQHAGKWKRLCLGAAEARRVLAADTHDPNWDLTDQITQWSVLH
jgi:hypothetical protein